MNNFHEQAMRFVYQQVLHRMLGFFSRTERIALQLLIQRLLVAGGGLERIGSYRVMVVHEGGKECAYTLAFLRAAQLSIAGRTPETFTLRVAVLHQPRVTAKVLERIQTQCNELFVYDDPRVEFLLVDETQVRQLNKQVPVVFERFPTVMDRMQMLMPGHLTNGHARATFFYADLLSRAKLYWRAGEWGGKVNALIDRRPPRHLAGYIEWIRRVAVQEGHLLKTHSAQGFESAVKLCSTLDNDFKHWLQIPVSQERAGPVEMNGEVSIINVFDCLSYEMEVLDSRILMFVEGAWNIKVLDVDEPQAAVVLLEAHLQGLRSLFVQGAGYHIGVQDFLRRAAANNQKNERFKGQLIKQMGGHFNTAKRIEKLRQSISQYLAELQGVTEQHLVCFLYSPFIEQASGLERFIQQCHPEKSNACPALLQALIEPDTASQDNVNWLETISGLPLSSLRVLYDMPKTDFRSSKNLIATLWAHDPNKQD